MPTTLYIYGSDECSTLLEATNLRASDIANLWSISDSWIQIRSISLQEGGGWLSGEALSNSEIVDESFSGHYSVSSPLSAFNHMPVMDTELAYFIDLYYNNALDAIPEILEEIVEDDPS